MAFTGWGDDLNNETSAVTVSGWTITNTTEGYAAIDVDDDGSDEYYYSEWDKGVQTENDLYEYLKWATRRGTSETLYGLNGELFRGVTHEIDVDTPTGTFNAFEAVSWSGGTGQMLAINSTTAATKMWIQLLTGAAPTDGQTITGGTSSATVDVDATVTEKNISAPFCGVSTGSNIIGAFGFGVEVADLTVGSKLTALDGSLNEPPAFATLRLQNLISGDSIGAWPEDTGFIDFDQMTLNGALTGAAVTSVVVNGSVPSDTPTTGQIRITRADGDKTLHPYSAWSGSTFTITSHDFSTNNAANGAGVVVGYFDGTASGAVEDVVFRFNAARDFFVSVRNGSSGNEIVPFETTVTVSAGGVTPVSAIRSSDS